MADDDYYVTDEVQFKNPVECDKCLSLHLPEDPHHPLWDKYLRALADLDNVQKRTRQEATRLVEENTRKIFLDLLSCLENILMFTRARKHESSRNFDNVEKIEDQIAQLLNQHQITPICPDMQPFDKLDLDKHQVIFTENLTANFQIVPLIQGYMLGDKVLKAAQVKIVDKE